jgi:phosphoenolpyruvate carboxylase
VGALLQITQKDNLLDDNPVLQQSIRLRNPYVDLLSYIQVDLLLTISAICSGMLNTG